MSSAPIMPAQPLQYCLPLIRGVTRHVAQAASLELICVGPAVSLAGTDCAAYGVSAAGSLEALSYAVRCQGGLAYRDTLNAGHAVVVLPSTVAMAALGRLITNEVGEVRLLGVWAYAPPA